MSLNTLNMITSFHLYGVFALGMTSARYTPSPTRRSQQCDQQSLEKSRQNRRDREASCLFHDGVTALL